jgi:beta-galactosidase
MDYEMMERGTNMTAGLSNDKEGLFFSGKFDLAVTGDVYFDMSGYSKGIVYVNGHNLGRYWSIGPQKRLYCPGVWLKKGENEIIVFDLHRPAATALTGKTTAE